MALTRQHLTALDGFDNRIDWNSALDRFNSRLSRTARGGDLFAAHAALFGTTFLGFFVWNLISNPVNMSSLRGFQYWGIAVAVHAVLAGGYAVVARMLNMDQPTFVTDAPPVYRTHQTPAKQFAPTAVRARGVESAFRVKTTARQWVAPSRQTPTSETSWPEQPAMLQATERIDVGEVTWPESAPLSTMLNSTPTRTASPSDELVSIDHGPSEVTGSQTWLDGFVESRSMDKEHRWSWVEAAAASWMAKRDKPGANRNPAIIEDVIIPDHNVGQADDDSSASS